MDLIKEIIYIHGQTNPCIYMHISIPDNRSTAQTTLATHLDIPTRIPLRLNLPAKTIYPAHHIDSTTHPSSLKHPYPASLLLRYCRRRRLSALDPHASSPMIACTRQPPSAQIHTARTNDINSPNPDAMPKFLNLTHTSRLSVSAPIPPKRTDLLKERAILQASM